MRFFYTLLALVLAVLTLFLSQTLVIAVIDIASVTDNPLSIDMAGAVKRAQSGKSAWVQLTDASADCNRYAHFTSRWQDGKRLSGAFIAQNPARDIEFAVVVHDIKECMYLGSVHYIGMLKELDADERRKFAADGLRLPENGGPRYWLCTWCVPEREWMGLIVLAALLLSTGAGMVSAWTKRGVTVTSTKGRSAQRRTKP